LDHTQALDHSQVMAVLAMLKLVDWDSKVMVYMELVETPALLGRHFLA
jgi:hypothetical protein